MGSNQAPYQAHDDSQTLGKYPIRVRVMVMVRVRVGIKVRVKLPTEELNVLRIIIN